MPSLPRQRRLPNKLQDSLPEPLIFDSVEKKYKSLYDSIFDSIVENINHRLCSSMIKPIIVFEKIIKGICDNNDLTRIKLLYSRTS